jgi:hypothetical protein
MIWGSKARVDTSSCCRSRSGGGCSLEVMFWGFWLDSRGKQGRVAQVGARVVQGWLRLVDTAANHVTWLCVSWAGFGLWIESIIVSSGLDYVRYYDFLTKILKEKCRITRSKCCQILKHLTDFHEISYEHRSIEGHSTYVLLNFLRLVRTTWWIYELVRSERQ